MLLGWDQYEMHNEFCYKNILKNGKLTDWGHGRIILKWILQKRLVGIWTWLNWLRIMPI